MLYRPAVAGNVGTVVRTSMGFGAVVHIVGPHLLDVMRDADVSRGAVGYLAGRHSGPSVVLYADVWDFARRTARLFHANRIIALSKMGRHGAQCLSRVRLWPDDGCARLDNTGPPLCLVLGNESSGLDGVPAVLMSSWRCVSIPMSPQQWAYDVGAGGVVPAAPLRCYNVAVTAGIAMWEAERQWRERRGAGDEAGACSGC